MTTLSKMLTGRTLNGVEKVHLDEPRRGRAYGGVFGQNQEAVVFHTTDGDIVFLADGDCCSQTYIESIDGPRTGKVVSVNYSEFGSALSKEGRDGEYVEHYRATLVIEGKGNLDIEFRNESNGYYGGSLSYVSGP